MKKGQYKRVFSGRIVEVETGKITLPNGHTLEMEKINHPGGAAVAAIDENRKLCFLKQYRCVLEEWLWELPAGKIDDKEPPIDTARRELKEETGIVAASWDSLGYMVSSPGVFTERVHLYLARQFIEQGEVEHDRDEVFELGWIDLEEAYDLAIQGGITDAKSVIAICRARQLLSNENSGR